MGRGMGRSFFSFWIWNSECVLFFITIQHMHAWSLVIHVLRLSLTPWETDRQLLIADVFLRTRCRCQQELRQQTSHAQWVGMCVSVCLCDVRPWRAVHAAAPLCVFVSAGESERRLGDRGGCSRAYPGRRRKSHPTSSKWAHSRLRWAALKSSSIASQGKCDAVKFACVGNLVAITYVQLNYFQCMGTCIPLWRG